MNRARIEDETVSSSVQQRHYQAAFREAGRARWRREHRLLAFYERRLLRALCAEDPHLPLPVLEVGCGQGQNLMDVTREARGLRGVGTDIVTSGLRVALGLAGEQQVRANVDFVAAEATKLPFRDDTFRLTYCRDLLHHVSDPAVVLQEMRRVVAPGGIVAALEANVLHPQYPLVAVVMRTERGLMRSTGPRLRGLFATLDLQGSQLKGLEFFPRMTLLEYSSPFRSALSRASDKTLERLEILEGRLERTRVLQPIAAYVMAWGRKPISRAASAARLKS